MGHMVRLGIKVRRNIKCMKRESPKGPRYENPTNVYTLYRLQTSLLPTRSFHPQ